MAIGRSTPDIGWRSRTDGSERYVADVVLDGMLEARVLRSPHPHALIRSVDTSEAREIPGVHAVITAADMPDVVYTHEIPDRSVLASDVVRFVGQEVAAVAAEDRATAEEATRRIRVRYRRIRSAPTVDEALAPGAPSLHDRRGGGNVSLSIERSYGDVEQALAETRFDARARYVFARQAHASMETNGTVARWDHGSGTLDLWTSTQSPYFVRKEVAAVLELDPESVRVHEVAVGGGFGSKSKITDHEAIAARLSMVTGRPVRLLLGRDEEFATTKTRHEIHVDLTTGSTADGRLTHRIADVVVDNGAYNHSGPSVTGSAVTTLASMYRTDAVSVRARLVDTNKVPGGQFRGYGAPQALFAIESQMDELADSLGMDPIELRILNANLAGDVTHAGWELASARLVECLERARDAIDWDTKRAAGGAGRGVGVACAIHVSGARTYENANRSDAAVEVDGSGGVRVLFGGSDPGTGLRTLLAQIVGGTLGVDIQSVSVTTMDTERTTLDLGSWSSRGTFMGGHAARVAAEATAERLKELAADKMGIDVERVELAGGAAHGPVESIGFGDLVTLGSSDGVLRIEESYTVDTEMVDRVHGRSNISPTYSFAAHAAEVEVDAETGRVRILDYVAVHDLGTSLNPLAVEGQIIGGVAMGLGAALGEELIHEDGRAVNPAYVNYALPRAADMPPVRVITLEHADPVGPYGAKSVGEISLNPVPAAVANAVAHATGTRIRSIPLTPDSVFTALHGGSTMRLRGRWWARPSRWWIHLVRWLYPRGLHRVLHASGTRLGRQEPVTISRMLRPTSVAEAVRAASHGAHIIAGGTDLLPAMDQGLTDRTVVVDIGRLAEIDGVSERADGALVIGSGTTLADLSRTLDPRADAVLVEAIGSIASQQIREMATVGGNLLQRKRCWFYRNGFPCYKRSGPSAPCYAVLGDHRFYHAVMDAHRCQAVTPSDLATVFGALDAVAEVCGRDPRQIPVAELYLGPGEPALETGEILTRVIVPGSARDRPAAFDKLCLWQGDFAVASVCSSVEFDGSEVVTDARVVLGGVAPTPFRAKRIEQALLGRSLDEERIRHAAEIWTADADPLDGNVWKVGAVSGLVARSLRRLVPRRWDGAQPADG